MHVVVRSSHHKDTKITAKITKNDNQKETIMKNIKLTILLLTLLIANSYIHAQEGRVMTFSEYMNNVKNNNISYLIEKYNVDIADANLKAAKAFPDPELSVGYGNNQNWNMQMGYGVDAELGYTFNLGNARKARMRVAQSEKEMSQALLEDYFRNLRADATIAYLTALKEKKSHEIQELSYLRMLELAKADSVRFRLGDITEIDARQTKLEAAGMRNDLYVGEGNLQEALTLLLLFEGSREMSMPVAIAGEIGYNKRQFNLQELIIAAQNNRADLQAALKSKEMSQNNLRLAKANRAMELGISIGGGYSSIVLNETAPAPAFGTISAGITIPLKFSSINKGEVRAAQNAAKQSELEYEAIEQLIGAEVQQAYNNYILCCRQVEQFASGMLEDAEAILEKITYGYERGETGILEVLNAQRTYNDIQMSYHETLYNCAVALIELERACGLGE